MTKSGAIILAAGKGTRMKSERAKVTFSLAGKSLLQRVIDTALKSKCDPIVVVVGYKKEEVIASLRPHPSLVFVEQIEQKGTGHAVLTAQEKFKDYDGNLYILCGDVPLLTDTTLKGLLMKHQTDKSSCTVLTVKLPDPATYGRIIRKDNGDVSRIVEFKDATDDEKLINEINSGIYCFDCQSLFQSLQRVTPNNQQGEYYLTDTLEILREQGKKVSALITENIPEVSGINSQLQLANLEDQLYKEIKEYWLNNGVSIENPTTVIIGEDVRLGTDVSIGANTIIKGQCNIESFVDIGPNCFIQDTIIKKNAIIRGFNVLINADIEEEAQIDWGKQVIE